MSRRLKPCETSLSNHPLTPVGKLTEWLKKQAGSQTYTLLAHLDDGIVWGCVTQAGVITGRDAAHGINEYEVLVSAFTPVLRWETLQTLRFFNETEEKMLWCSDGQWQLRTITDDDDPINEIRFMLAFDEPQLLWGTKATPLNHGFTLMEDGDQGLRHVVPLDLKAREWTLPNRPLRLHMRHYLRADPNTGVARIAANRLVKLEEV